MIDLISKYLDFKAGSITRTPCHSNRASLIGYFVPELGGCLRRGVYERTHWAEKELHDVKTQLLFDEGKNQERQVLADLAYAGFPIIEQQTMYEWKNYQITGHVDGKIIYENKAIPIEIKSSSYFIFSQINCFEDLKKRPWTRAYMAQITLYMLMQNIDIAIFIFKNKSTGELKQVNVGLDYELGEQCLKAVESINEHIKKNTLPDKITDRQKCRDCPFKTICLPDVNFGEELKIADDPDFEKRINRYMELKDIEKEASDIYEVLKNRIKATMKDKEKIKIIVGQYQIQGKLDARKAFRFSIERI